MGGTDEVDPPAIGLDDVLITEQLRLRPSHPPDHAAENRALGALAESLADSPESILQTLADLALDLCRADSAGISILESGPGPVVFRWPAIAGAWARHVGGSPPGDASPCCVLLDWDATLLFRHPGRYFPDVWPVEPPLIECLLVPLRVGGEPVGTVWVNAHSPDRRFDAEDARLLESLARFAAAGYRVAAATSATAAGRDELERRVAERTRELTAAGDARRRIEALHRAIAANLPGGAIFVVDRDLRYRLADGQTLRDAGLTPADLEGKILGEALGPELAGRHEPYYRAALVGEPFQVEHAGFGRHFVSRGVPLRDECEIGAALVVSYDVTERKRAEETARSAAARDAFRVRLADALRPLADPAEIQAAACRVLGEHLGAGRVYYGVVSGDGQATIIERDYHAPEVASTTGRFPIASFGPTLMGVMAAGRTLTIPDVGAEHALTARERATYAALDIAAAVWVPLVKGGRWVASLGVHHRTPRRWTSEEVALIEETAERTWAAVERAQAEAALRERDEQLSLAQRAARLGVSSLDLRTGVGVTTPEWREVIGFPDPPARQDFATFMELVHPDDRERVAALHDLPAALDYEFRVNHPTRGERWLLSRSRLLPAADGGPGRLVGIALDITDRKVAEDRLRASEARFRGLAEAVPQIVWTSTNDAVDYFNSRWFEFSGLTPADGLGEAWHRVVHPDDLAEARRRSEHSSRTGGRYEVEYRLRRADGAYRWHIARAVRVPETGRWIGTATDIHDLKRAEDALRASESRLAMALRAAGAGAWEWDFPGGFQRWSPGLFDLFGVVPVGYATTLPPEERVRIDDLLRDHLARRDPNWDEEYRIEHPTRGTRRLATSGTIRYGDDGTPRNLLGITIDVTDRYAAEAAVREGRERLRLALTAARMGIWIWDAATDMQTRDENLDRLMGLDPVESSQPFREFLGHIHPDDRAAVAGAFASSVRRGRPPNLEFRIIRPDGVIRWLRDQGDIFGGPAGGPTHMAGACGDVTDLKEAEATLRRARDELEDRVTERTAGLARANEELTRLLRRLVTAQEDERRRVARELHDGLGQELTGLILGLKALERAIPENAPGRDRLREVEAAVGRIGREAHDLAVELRPTAPDDIGVGPALAAYIARWSARTGVVADFQTPGLDGDRLLPDVETTVYRLVQEALNNVARHAEAGCVSVIVERRHDEVIGLVEDDGRGFDPGRIGAEAGRRSMGLLGMRERVALLGGSLLIESGEGEGTTVRARIPLRQLPGGDGHAG